jgi:hypothetical protein
LPLVLEFPFNLRVFLLAFGIAVPAAAIVDVLPALRISTENLSGLLHEGGRSLTGRGQHTRSVLVAAQVAGSVALLIVAGLFIRVSRAFSAPISVSIQPTYSTSRSTPAKSAMPRFRLPTFTASFSHELGRFPGCSRRSGR